MVDFRYPYIFAFYGLLALFGILQWIWRKRKSEELSHWGSEKVRDRLFSQINQSAIRWKNRMTYWGLILLIFAATGPQIGMKLTEVKRKGVDVLVALDISSSMQAEDVKPNRLEKAKFEISRLISNLKGDRIGLIVFAGTSHLYLPLTGDYDAARLFLGAIDTKLIQTQGTALQEALELGMKSFPQESEKYKVLVVITDGEDHEGQALEFAREVASTGIIIHTVGVGTHIGGLIPVFNDNGNRIDYKKDRRGKLITTILNEGMLKDLALAGNGVFTRFDNRANAVEDLLNVINVMEKRTLKTHQYSQFEDRYQIFLSASLILFTTDLFITNRRKRRGTWHGRFV